MAPAQIGDMVIDLAASNLRKLQQLKAVKHADLIVPGEHVAVSSLERDLIAVDQFIRRIIKMSVAEPARHRNRGAG